MTSGHLGSLTEHQAAVLSAFHNRIPDVLESIGIHEYLLWGTTFSRSSEPCDSASMIILKFLRAREFHLDSAIKMFTDCIKWRIAIDIENLQNDSRIRTAMAADYMHARDFKGRPILWTKFGSLESCPITESIELFVKYRIAVFESATKALIPLTRGQPETICCVQDASAVALFSKIHFFSNAISSVSELLGRNFPEWNAISIFVEFPVTFSVVLNSAMLLMPEKTRNKIAVVRSGEIDKLCEYVAPINIPLLYGGLDTGLRPSNQHGSFCIILQPMESRENVSLTEIPAGSHNVSITLRATWGTVGIKIFMNSDQSTHKSQSGRSPRRRSLTAMNISEIINTEIFTCSRKVTGPGRISLSCSNGAFLSRRVLLMHAEFCACLE